MVSLCSMTGAVNKECPTQGVNDLKNAGFIAAVLDYGDFAGVEHVIDKKYKPDLMRQYYEKTVTAFQDMQVGLPIAKLPFLSPDSGSKGIDKKVSDAEYKVLGDLILQISMDCIVAAETAGCEMVIVQPLLTRAEHGDGYLENKDYYLRLAGHCTNKNTKILLINQCNNIGGHFVRGICSDGVTAAEWVDRLNDEIGFERFGFCLDVGVCNLCGQDIQCMAGALGARIQAVILTENNGRDNAQLLPFTSSYVSRSTLGWLGLFRGLRECGFDGYLILEAKDTIRSFSPLLRPNILSFCKTLMEYFEMQIGIENNLKKYNKFVLFGAGNMCRNYMKCYGEKYPPLYTCDNNPKFWGTTFAGLKVKNPKELKDLSKDCCVVICNIYYREIEAQLKQMGIENIGYFNDEYMPTYYVGI